MKPSGGMHSPGEQLRSGAAAGAAVVRFISIAVSTPPCERSTQEKLAPAQETQAHAINYLLLKQISGTIKPNPSGAKGDSNCARRKVYQANR